ncbi:MAG TPA: T9SS type A sorting domain-containing protein [Bacteroidia bacterium]|nr:T9SS type A sorting domain-containing protein [Bacteroidia bacterium]
MTTPAGTFNVLRLKHYEYDVDSIFLQDNSIFHVWAFSSLATPPPFHVCAYTWYANGIHTPIASMITDTTYTIPKSVGWYSGIEGINELSDKSKTLVYPNPCTTQITFKYGTEFAKYIVVFDITGRQVVETTMENGSVSLNTSVYAKGIYLFQVNDKSGNMLDRGKFLVQ